MLTYQTSTRTHLELELEDQHRNRSDWFIDFVSIVTPHPHASIDQTFQDVFASSIALSLASNIICRKKFCQWDSLILSRPLVPALLSAGRDFWNKRGVAIVAQHKSLIAHNYQTAGRSQSIPPCLVFVTDHPDQGNLQGIRGLLESNVAYEGRCLEVL